MEEKPKPIAFPTHHGWGKTTPQDFLPELAKGFPAIPGVCEGDNFTCDMFGEDGDHKSEDEVEKRLQTLKDTAKGMKPTVDLLMGNAALMEDVKSDDVVRIFALFMYMAIEPKQAYVVLDKFVKGKIRVGDILAVTTISAMRVCGQRGLSWAAP